MGVVAAWVATLCCACQLLVFYATFFLDGTRRAVSRAIDDLLARALRR